MKNGIWTKKTQKTRMTVILVSQKYFNQKIIKCLVADATVFAQYEDIFMW